MCKTTSQDMTTIMTKWSEDKKKIAEIEERIEKYKKIAGKYMDKERITSYSDSMYTLRRTTMSRSSITKNDVPENIWKQYSKSCSFPAFYLTLNKK